VNAEDSSSIVNDIWMKSFVRYYTILLSDNC